MTNISENIIKVTEGIEKAKFFQGFYTNILNRMSEEDRLIFDLYGAGLDAELEGEDLEMPGGLFTCDRIEFIFNLNAALFLQSFEFNGIKIELDFCAKEFTFESELINFESDDISDFEDKLKRLGMTIKGEF